MASPKRTFLKFAITSAIIGVALAIAIGVVGLYLWIQGIDRRRFPSSGAREIKLPTAAEMLDTSLALPSFEARDPDSPTVVRVYAEDARPRRRPFIWSCSISVDGRQPTQYAGWPKGRIPNDAEPTAVVWHGDPNWVEIVLSNGQQLKLTWDEELAQQARDKQAGLFYIKPYYEVLGGPGEKAGEGRPSAAQDYPWQGQLVMSRVAKPKFIDLVEGKPVAVDLMGLDWLVVEVKGDRLRLRGPDGREGWLEKKDAQPDHEALHFYSDLIRINPKDFWALSCRGTIRLRKGKFDAAIQDLNEAIRLEPNYATAYTYRGIAWNYKLDFGNALKDFDEAIRLEPKYGTALTFRGHAWSQKKDYDRAIKDFTQAIEINPADGLAYRFRGQAWLSKKEYDTAISDFDVVVRLGHEDFWTVYSRGQAYARKKNYGQAIKDFDEAMRLDPKSADAVAWRGYAWWRLKDYDHALIDCEAAIRLDPTNFFALYYRGMVRAKNRDYGGAIKDFDEAIRISPKYPGPISSKAYLLATCSDATIRDGKTAVELAKQSCELTNWKTGWMLRSLAAAYAEIGQFEEAIQWQRKAMEDPEYMQDDLEKDKPQKLLSAFEKKQPWREE